MIFQTLSQITYNNLEISLQIMLLPKLITPDEPSLFLTSTGNSRGLQLSLVLGGLFSSRLPNTSNRGLCWQGGRLETRKTIRDATLSRNEDHFLVSFSPVFFSLFLCLIYDRDLFTGLLEKNLSDLITFSTQFLQICFCLRIIKPSL